LYNQFLPKLNCNLQEVQQIQRNSVSVYITEHITSQHVLVMSIKGQIIKCKQMNNPLSSVILLWQPKPQFLCKIKLK